MGRPSKAERVSPAYARVEGFVDDDVAVILDGGNATELGREHAGRLRDADRGLWGTGALYDVPYSVLDVHRRYVEAGCDVISTNTWAILAAAELEVTGLVGRGSATNWMDIARLGVRLARQAVEEAGRTKTCAVAFSVNGDIDSKARLATLGLLLRALEGEPPDLVLMETMSLVREGLTVPGVELVVGSGLPVWLSFRAVVTASAASTGSTGAGPRATCSVGPRGPSKR
jgi:S-methylmethionine-dependent homocysteine/selenocysteine methylase